MRVPVVPLAAQVGTGTAAHTLGEVIHVAQGAPTGRQVCIADALWVAELYLDQAHLRAIGGAATTARAAAAVVIHRRARLFQRCLESRPLRLIQRVEHEHRVLARARVKAQRADDGEDGVLLELPRGLRQAEDGGGVVSNMVTGSGGGSATMADAAAR